MKKTVLLLETWGLLGLLAGRYGVLGDQSYLSEAFAAFLQLPYETLTTCLSVLPVQNCLQYWSCTLLQTSGQHLMGSAMRTDSFEPHQAVMPDPAYANLQHPPLGQNRATEPVADAIARRYIAAFSQHEDVPLGGASWQSTTSSALPALSAI